MQPFEMRTTFFAMRLLNDPSQVHDTAFIQNGNEFGKRKTEGERERERTGGECEEECGWERVAAWVKKFNVWSNIYEGL
jgi:hypothetical protein